MKCSFAAFGEQNKIDNDSKCQQVYKSLKKSSPSSQGTERGERRSERSAIISYSYHAKFCRSSGGISHLIPLAVFFATRKVNSTGTLDGRKIHRSECSWNWCSRSRNRSPRYTRRSGSPRRANSNSTSSSRRCLHRWANCRRGSPLRGGKYYCRCSYWSLYDHIHHFALSMSKYIAREVRSALHTLAYAMLHPN